MKTYIFNQKYLKKQLDSYEQKNIKSFGRKFQIIINWNRSLTESNLEKTKEEAIQGDFLYQIFTNVLGYKNRIGSQEWNLQQEQKTEMDNTKSDGALGFFSDNLNDPRVVIELKDAKTDLDRKQNRVNSMSPVEQAFSYQYKNKNVKWVIVSNFKEIRLYNSNTSTEFEQFFIKNLAEDLEEFKKFYFLLHKDHLISKNGPSKIDQLYENNEREEEKISKEFYSEYKKVRENLFLHLRENNPDVDELIIFEKTQKLLDRFIFVCFCEDTHLLPSNVFRNVIEVAENSFDLSDTKIWNQLKGLFHSIDKGNPKMDINRFNGGLFETDPVLDDLVIKDDIFESFLKITDYDFSTELGVNILGHIFEQSINDIEEIKAEIAGNKFNPVEGKRKKDGIFYTSPGVTKFLIEETLFQWIEDRKNELNEEKLPNLTEEDIIEFNRKRFKKRKRKKLLPVEVHIDFYTKLQQQLRNIKILDPACGSGAFLNMAFDNLILEGDKINRRLEELQNDQIELFDINQNILKNNLFGVDLNKESVEITKLSLWLKTANNTDPLTSLDENIKTGNSIIDDPSVSPFAFDWKREFPKVMDEGGFDIIIGNPPYVFARNQGFTQEEKDYYEKHYNLLEYQINTYLIFIEKAYHLLKKGGWFAFIVPNTCLTIDSFKKMRRFLLKNTGNLKIINIYDRMFDQADVDTCFIIFQKTKPNTVKLGEYINEQVEIVAEVKPEELIDEQSIINISLMKNKKYLDILEKIELNSVQLNDVSKPSTGLKAYQVGKGKPPQTDEIKESRAYHSKEKIDDSYIPYLEGADVKRYSLDWTGEYLKYGDHLAEPRKSVPFDGPRILVRQIPTKGFYAINAAYTEKHYLNDINSMVIFNFKENPLFLLGVINSKIITFWFINKFDKFQRKTFPQFKVKELKLFPIPKVSAEKKKEIAALVDEMLKLQREKAKFYKKFEIIIQNELEIDTVPPMFHKFYEWTSNEWLERIIKMKKITLSQRGDWLDFYDKNKEFIMKYMEKEETLNQLIDLKVAEAFGLSKEETELVDTSLNEFLNEKK